MNKKGFNYVELLIILAIIVVVSAVVYPVIGANSRFVEDESVRETCIDNVAKITKALLMYIEDWDDTTPRCYGPGSGATVATFGAKLNDGRPNGIGCLFDYVESPGTYATWLAKANTQTGNNAPDVFRCPSDIPYSNTWWTCSYFCGPSPYPFWPGGTDYWGREGESISEYENLSTSAAIIEVMQFFYWRGIEVKGHNYTTPCGFLDGHVEVFPVLTPKQLYRDQNQDYDWEITSGYGPCDASGNYSWGQTSAYWNPQLLYEYYWSKDDVQWVLLNESNITIEKGTVYPDLIADILPETAFNKNVIWSSSDESVATVDENGFITAVDNGTATITVTTEECEFTDECEVTVKTSVTGVELNQTKISIEKGNTYNLVAIVSPNDASNKNIIWSTDNESVATVDNNGVITAIADGNAIITATTEDNGFTATCEVTVATSVTGVKLNKSGITIDVGKTYSNLKATVLPEDATNKDVSWSSNKTSVATVDQNGIITGVGAGIAYITVKTEEGGFTAKIKVNVKSYAVTGVKLNKSGITLDPGATYKNLKATVLPDNATNKEVTWSSSKTSVATVDQNGIVKAVGAGTAYIKVKTKDGGFTAQCKVKVNSCAVTGVKLNKSGITITKGSTYNKLKATILPEQATNKNVTWSSSKTSVVIVDKNGVITGVGVGTAYITVKTVDGGYTAKCKITVK